MNRVSENYKPDTRKVRMWLHHTRIKKPYGLTLVNDSENASQMAQVFDLSIVRRQKVLDDLPFLLNASYAPEKFLKDFKKLSFADKIDSFLNLDFLRMTLIQSFQDCVQEQENLKKEMLSSDKGDTENIANVIDSLSLHLRDHEIILSGESFDYPELRRRMMQTVLVYHYPEIKKQLKEHLESHEEYFNQIALPSEEGEKKSSIMLQYAESLFASMMSHEAAVEIFSRKDFSEQVDYIKVLFEADEFFRSILKIESEKYLEAYRQIDKQSEQEKGNTARDASKEKITQAAQQALEFFDFFQKHAPTMLSGLKKEADYDKYFKVLLDAESTMAHEMSESNGEKAKEQTFLEFLEVFSSSVKYYANDFYQAMHLPKDIMRHNHKFYQKFSKAIYQAKAQKLDESGDKREYAKHLFEKCVDIYAKSFPKSLPLKREIGFQFIDPENTEVLSRKGFFDLDSFTVHINPNVKDPKLEEVIAHEFKHPIQSNILMHFNDWKQQGMPSDSPFAANPYWSDYARLLSWGSRKSSNFDDTVTFDTSNINNVYATQPQEYDANIGIALLRQQKKKPHLLSYGLKLFRKCNASEAERLMRDKLVKFTSKPVSVFEDSMGRVGFFLKAYNQITASALYENALKLFVPEKNEAMLVQHDNKFGVFLATKPRNIEEGLKYLENSDLRNVDPFLPFGFDEYYKTVKRPYNKVNLQVHQNSLKSKS